MIHEHSAGIVVFAPTQDLNAHLYLLLRYAAGHWDFAKGHIEPGEDKKQTALRELHEEAGISATLMSDFEYSFSYAFEHHSGEMRKKTVYFFIGCASSMQVQLSDEHIDYAWLSYHDALTRLTYENAQILLAQVEQELQKKILG